MVQFQPKSSLQEDILGVSSTNNNPDLTVPPWPPNANSAKEPTTTPPSVPKAAPRPCCSPDPNSTVTQQEPCPQSAYSLEQPKKGILKQSSVVPADNNMAAVTAGRSAPGEEHPTAKPPVPNELRPVPQEKPPCYLPQPEDATMSRQELEMGPIGPWATGRVDWGPLGGLTGTRPVVDKYSITRYSIGEWKKHNKEMLDMSQNEAHRSNL